jgi:alkylhydroperoxidase family enzyme
MTISFELHDEESTPPEARPQMAALRAKYGTLPNMMAIMAESPEMLEAYLAMSDIWSRTSLSPLERDVVLIAINRENACRYCMASQSFVSARTGMPTEVLSALRAGKPISDPRLQALRLFAESVVCLRGWTGDAEMSAFLDAGFTRRNVFEVIIAASFKTLSNYTDHVTDAPVDAAFREYRWERPANGAA